ncbi:hypothetical protein ARAM_001740 [Aspergillus rambellii]|uniref:Cytochrome P450 n=1 Tax=Aspergillus rambellii TaxID=308745 RepID=A0A0F8UL10_9EURO|nr:hypothetical protein ARAM_001740 [Aspergillus rambellii]
MLEIRLGPNVVSICEHVEIANISRRRLWEELVQNGRRLSDSSVTSTNQIRWHLREIQDYEGSIDESLKNIIKSIRRHRVLDLPSSLRYFAEDFINRVMINDPSINDDRTAGMPKTNTPSTQLSTATILCSMEDMVLKGPVSLLKRERFSCSGIGSSMSKLPEYATELISNPIRAAAQPLTPRDSILSIGIESMTATFVSTFCFLLSNPIVMATLKSEINTMLRFREKAAIPSWSEIRRYSYLDAVQKESMRHFTSRSETQEILGTASSWNHSRLPLPPKTIVTWHPHVLQFDRSVYGDDVNTFRPGRWLVTDTTQRNLMEKSLLPFNVCVEAYPIAQAAWLELKKAVVVLLSNFDVSYATSLLYDSVG